MYTILKGITHKDWSLILDLPLEQCQRMSPDVKREYLDEILRQRIQELHNKEQIETLIKQNRNGTT